MPGRILDASKRGQHAAPHPYPGEINHIGIVQVEQDAAVTAFQRCHRDAYSYLALVVGRDVDDHMYAVAGTPRPQGLIANP